ncbi:GNAT family N-acetyltransferase [Phycicoccus sonneratiae]|uniref:GNAT family N-acetyltransferase n=1 Tax=Phycicoccus sonneratiae TaxID=2807628 RepID=A0ABS2CG92_9MICO|nr:GNAT family N-acetyltransferase [Phycicoccus sonneraticus]MBM6398888.1 GNAT family N-acetyltransferase [Phycicoccus sonneraticus]
MSGEHVLDDVAWHALTGPQAHLAESSPDGLAHRYRPAVGPFCGVEHLDEAGWRALAALVGAGGVAVFLRAEVEPTPAGWAELVREPAVQYVASALADPPPTDDTVLELGAADSSDMQRLVAETEPGPFGPESQLTGRWFGVRREGRLVAMAGERMRVPGFGEVSGVCVAASARGSGLGAVVTLAAARAIAERGDTAMLHVRQGNEGAERLYRRCGFVVRRSVEVVVLRRGA